ncbi:lysophospholipid acyltransferase family protein [Flammeovirga sp. SubArs3]|uniref:lysophospholipid acyltransferase family protein n=1 Tax=Flammeovirga sp. SubArs3 TaxID=2995316 RepID=UPI00248C2504|nr:lysophospholipid acyltransferase family protein [Flammeovirga sp. SubArs3]
MNKLKFSPFYLLSLLPINVLYIFSDILYVFIFKVFQYRRDIVMDNLIKSFPEKKYREIREIEKRFYHHFCDIMFESIKTLTMNKREIEKRFKIKNPELIQELYHQNKNIVLYSAHLGNWEWCTFLPLFLDHKVTAFYQPLSNKYFDELMKLIRSRLGVLCIPSQNGYKTLLKLKAEKKLTFNLIIGDQSPSHKSSRYWTHFLHRETAFLMGADVISNKNNCAVIYPQCIKVKRGVYETQFIVLDESPRESQRHSVIEKYSKALEENINQQPYLWLWSHNRWKLSA